MGTDRQIIGFTLIDSFSTSLEDMSINDKKDSKKVLDVIVNIGRFSTFDIDDHLAPSVDELFDREYLKSDDSVGFPWIEAVITERGAAWRRGEITVCQKCNGDGYVSKKLSGRNYSAVHCDACKHTGFIPTPPKGTK